MFRGLFSMRFCVCRSDEKTCVYFSQAIQREDPWIVTFPQNIFGIIFGITPHSTGVALVKESRETHWKFNVNTTFHLILVLFKVKHLYIIKHGPAFSMWDSAATLSSLIIAVSSITPRYLNEFTLFIVIDSTLIERWYSGNILICVHFVRCVQLKSRQVKPVVHLMTLLSCVSLSVNTRPSAPAFITYVYLKAQNILI